MKLARQIALFTLLISAFASLQISPALADPGTDRVTDRASFQRYLDLFNHKDPSAFERYYAPDARMSNGNLVFQGVAQIKEHYRKIWGAMDEEVAVEEFVYDGKTLAVQLHATFHVPRDAQDTPFGPIRQGERFDFRGAVLYKFDAAGKFSDVRIAYYGFTRTTDGVTHSMGMPH
ncbi:nuclear transport factor 2 family protein [Pseudomonas sp. LRF_L74]|uniref:nuclear transport factor 2 family protein n=1 Tax=Pseudomonas sp. LRF_L74 TaxID=3369422 RepID=UPI003F61CC11